MRFFHIRYECNDARDDFSAMRKQLEKGSGSYINRDDLDEMDTCYYIRHDELPIREREARVLDAVHTMRRWLVVSGSLCLIQ